jgi:tetratricopeptide (TPR) repeat protein
VPAETQAQPEESAKSLTSESRRGDKQLDGQNHGKSGKEMSECAKQQGSVGAEQKVGKCESVTSVLAGVAWDLIVSGRFEPANVIVDQALELSDTMSGQDEGKAAALHAKGVLLARNRELSAAIQTLEAALEQSRTVHGERDISLVYILMDISWVLTETNKLSAAMEQLTLAQEIAEGTPAEIEVRTARKRLCSEAQYKPACE